MVEWIKHFNYHLLNYIDILILVTVFISVIFAVVRGFIASVISLLGWGVSLLTTYYCGGMAQKFLAAYISSEPILVVVSYSSLLIITLIVFAIPQSIFATMTSDLRGGFFDRLLGALFGLFRGALIISFAFMCFNAGITFLATTPGEEVENEKLLPVAVTHSQCYKLLQIGNAVLSDLFPMASEIVTSSKTNSVSLVEHFADDKFIGSMVRKIYHSIGDNEIELIERELERTVSRKDEKERARLALRYYQNNHAKNGNLDANEIERLKRILSDASSPDE